MAGKEVMNKEQRKGLQRVRICKTVFPEEEAGKVTFV